MTQDRETIHWIPDGEFGTQTACKIKIEGLEDLEITPEGDWATCEKCAKIYNGSQK